MRQAQARKVTDAYLSAPKRAERHLHAVDEARVDVDAASPPYVVEDLRIEAPEVEIPDWAEPFADPRWDDRLGEPEYEERDGRRTVLVTGRPEGKAVPRREITATPSRRVRRQSPTRARLAGRPDRVALWAVALGLLMAAMAGFTGGGSGGGHGHSSHSDLPSTAPLLSR
jgi:hypothetical protein